ncbi:S-protein homolog 3-like [Arachis hypogaea]|uniref:S-protein homolog n=1 Tax=Arachis hypogaea TaxID=3818 RepID=A0A445DD88_ARAHY|nr:S-protein homolog 3-like [Arachis hypogaea]RYR61128.1 hypothetical protein Ahy_A04g018257 [Arachis hypogaea]RYR61129.1 hypothetical protein Ahy_A04g018258 [Arachis hypogaea]
MAHLARSIFILWLLTMLPFFGNVLSRSSEISVAIQNLLEDQDDLTVHCKSRDDDIRVQYLKSHEHFLFHFRPNIFGTTLFYCSFAWEDGVCRRFDIYEYDRDKTYTDITWQIFKEGPCRFIENNGHDDTTTRKKADGYAFFDNICFQWSHDSC